jgi:ABC-2 type transport system permease protein/oleandomycin transport system permease protein
MTKAASSSPAIEAPGSFERMIEGLQDTMTIARRNLIGIWRTPQLLAAVLFAPVLFVLLFRYVLGGAINISSVTSYSYADYLMPGMFVMTLFFSVMVTATGLAADVQNGLIERLRSLPMARYAFIAGRTSADLVRNVPVLALVVAMGFAVGFRVHTSAELFILGLLLALLFAYSASWFFALIGLFLGNPEAADAAASFVMLPLIFASSALVPVSSMPSWLQGFAAHQPVSVAIGAVRALSLGGPAASHVWETLAWSLGIVLICAPVSVWWYKRAA